MLTRKTTQIWNDEGRKPSQSYHCRKSLKFCCVHLCTLYRFSHIWSIDFVSILEFCQICIEIWIHIRTSLAHPHSLKSNYKTSNMSDFFWRCFSSGLMSVTFLCILMSHFEFCTCTWGIMKRFFRVSFMRYACREKEMKIFSSNFLAFLSNKLLSYFLLSCARGNTLSHSHTSLAGQFFYEFRVFSFFSTPYMSCLLDMLSGRIDMLNTVHDGLFWKPHLQQYIVADNMIFSRARRCSRVHLRGYHGGTLGHPRPFLANLFLPGRSPWHACSFMNSLIQNHTLSDFPRRGKNNQQHCKQVILMLKNSDQF